MAQPIGNMIDEVMSHGGAIRFDSVGEHDALVKFFHVASFSASHSYFPPFTQVVQKISAGSQFFVHVL